ncbi:lipoate protein ligase C-terminal domain-containing protein, partial [Staphylococcus epidermidis]
GDFFGIGDVSDIEDRLTGVKYERSEIAKALENIDIRHYFGNIGKEEVLDLIY